MLLASFRARGSKLIASAPSLRRVCSLEVYQLLTAERGWTPDRWEAWINGTLTGTLLQ
jgi:hypothetical protein